MHGHALWQLVLDSALLPCFYHAGWDCAVACGAQVGIVAAERRSAAACTMAACAGQCIADVVQFLSWWVAQASIFAKFGYGNSDTETQEHSLVELDSATNQLNTSSQVHMYPPRLFAARTPRTLERNCA